MNNNSSIQEAQEGNKLILEFIGSEYIEAKGLWYKGGGFCDTFPNGNHYARPDQIKYRYSFDWVMPVVERIQIMENGRYYIHVDPFYMIVYDYKEDTETAVVELQFDVIDDNKLVKRYFDIVTAFIQYYNSLSTKTETK